MKASPLTQILTALAQQIRRAISGQIVYHVSRLTTDAPHLLRLFALSANKVRMHIQELCRSFCDRTAMMRKVGAPPREILHINLHTQKDKSSLKLHAAEGLHQGHASQFLFFCRTASSPDGLHLISRSNV